MTTDRWTACYRMPFSQSQISFYSSGKYCRTGRYWSFFVTLCHVLYSSDAVQHNFKADASKSNLQFSRVLNRVLLHRITSCFLLLWSTHPGARPRDLSVAAGGATPRKKGPGGTKDAGETFVFSTQLHIATWKCAGLFNRPLPKRLTDQRWTS